MKGIMFKEPLFNAILAGQKTQTRRVIRENCNCPWYHNTLLGEWALSKCHGIIDGVLKFDIQTDVDDYTTEYYKPRYKVGEVVYLKEPYEITTGYSDNRVIYKFDNDPEFKQVKWANKMFMPRQYARYFIKITNVRVERLQEIGYLDIYAEGFDQSLYESQREPVGVDMDMLEQDWVTLWNSINKPPFDWATNPWVWVYEFELTEKPNQ